MREEAEADFRAALALKIEHAAAHSALAVLLDAGGGGKEALAHHRSAAELAPNSPQLLNNLGFALYVRGRHEEAIATLREALRLAPADSRVRNNLGFAYARAGDFSRAAREFSSAGTEAQAKNNLGFAYEQDGNLAAAYALYDEALRLDPQLEQARQNLAHVAEKLDRPGPKAVDSPLRSAGGTDASSTNAD